MRYLLLEIQQLLGRLEKCQHQDGECTCRDEQEPF
jgi:hypothetical protein